MTSSNFDGLHHRQVCRLGTLQDPPGIDGDLAPGIREIGSVAHQPTDFAILPLWNRSREFHGALQGW